MIIWYKGWNENTCDRKSSEQNPDKLDSKKAYDDLVSTFANQNAKIYKDLYTLKQKEVRENSMRRCRVNTCKSL